MNKKSQRILGLLRLASFLAVLLPASTSFATTVTFCATWRFSYYDNLTTGQEDGLRHTAGQGHGDIPASYTRAEVKRNGVVVGEGHLNSSGCMAPITLVAGTYTMSVTSYLLRSDGVRISVHQGTPSGYYTGYSKYYTNNSPPPSGNVSVTLSFGNAGDAPANAMAAASQFVRESAIGFAPNAHHKIVVNAGGWAHALGFVAYMGSYQGINDAAWKYVIGHEVGHTIQDQLFGVPSPPQYDDDDSTSAPDICSCDHLILDPNNNDDLLNAAHCMQSRENGTAAQGEGFGHFIALDLMNDDTQIDGFFTYYKAIQCPSVVNTTAIPGCAASNVVAPAPLAVNGRSTHKWKQNRCPLAARGTELDWMNFYFQLHTRGDEGQFYFTQIRDTYRGACSGSNCANDDITWLELRDSARALYGTGSPRADHWEETGGAYGVNL